MKKVLCLLTALCLIFLVGCEYRLVKDDGIEKIIAPNGTEYILPDISIMCMYGVAYDNLKNRKIGEVQVGDFPVSIYISTDEDIIVMGDLGLSSGPSFYVKEGYDMPDLTKPEKIEALYYIPRSTYNMSGEDRESNENYYENYRLPIEQSDAIEFAKGLSQYIATDTTGYFGGDSYYGYLIVKYTGLELYFGYYMWGCEGTDNIQIQGDTYNEDLEMYNYYNVPIEYLSFIPLVKEETRD